MEKIIIQITSGRGPVECGRVVAKVQERMLAQATSSGIETEVLENKKADLRRARLCREPWPLSINCNRLVVKFRPAPLIAVRRFYPI